MFSLFYVENSEISYKYKHFSSSKLKYMTRREKWKVRLLEVHNDGIVDFVYNF